MKFLVCAALLAAGSACAQNPPQFTIQDLGGLQDLPDCSATALSQSGNVVGWCAPNFNWNLIGTNGAGSPPVDAFLFTNGAIQDLNLGMPGFQTPVPTAVNDSGMVAGAYLNIGLDTETSASAFVVQGDGSVQILQGTVQALLPFGLNNTGQIAGTRLEVSNAFNYFLNSQALLTTAGGAKPVVLPPPAGILGTGTAAAFGMSPSGNWVAGASVSPGANSVLAMVWQAEKPQSLPVLSNYAQSVATAVNDSGTAVGVAFDMNLNVTAIGPVPGADAHAVLFSNGQATDIGTLEGDQTSMAFGINNSDWVVGTSSRLRPPLGLNLAPLILPVDRNYTAFLYLNGTMYSLTQLLQGGSQGWQLCSAVQVNNAGQIIGTGFYQQQQRAFLLTPVATQPSGPKVTSVVGAGLSVPPVTNISTNSLFTIYGTDFAAQSLSHAVTPADLVNGALPTNVDNVCVQGGNTKWGLLYVSATQINALAESVPASGTVPVSVIANCGTGNDVTSPALNVNAAAAAPEFLYFVANANGQDPVAAVQNSTGEYVGVPGLISGATFAPAHPGDVLVAFGVGWGATTSTDPIGALATAAASLTDSYSLKVGDQTANVLYAGLTPGFAGLYQVDFVVPSFPSGTQVDQTLVLTVNGVSTPTGAYITIVQ